MSTYSIFRNFMTPCYGKTLQILVVHVPICTVRRTESNVRDGPLQISYTDPKIELMNFFIFIYNWHC